MSVQDSTLVQPSALQSGNRYRRQHFINRVLLYIVVAIGVFVFMGPFVWSVLSSFKGPAEIYLFPPKVFPSELRWQNYAHVWETIPFGLFLLEHDCRNRSLIIGYDHLLNAGGLWLCALRISWSQYPLYDCDRHVDSAR